MERRKGGGSEESSVESPGAVSRSYTRSDRQQTQFTKRHLFHYSNALWLITSWPVCEMTATYSPVNRKICTCSIWGVEEPRSGGWGGRKGEREKTGENPRNTAFWQGRRGPSGRRMMSNSVSTPSSGAPSLRWKDWFSQLLLFLPVQGLQCQGLVAYCSPPPLPQGLGINLRARLPQSPGACKKRQLVGTRGRLVVGWG